MLSYASDGGGVGPHIDSYDVFLLQVQGRRRWRLARRPQLKVRDDVPLKMLASFTPEQDWVLEPGDMLYLPPGWAHDGVAVGGDCMTASIGFRAPRADELARALLARLADELPEAGDRGVTATRGSRPPSMSVRCPSRCNASPRAAVARAVANPASLERTLGEWLTEPKPQVWFEARHRGLTDAIAWCRLDRRSRMAYDRRHVYINGESLRAAGRDARLVHRLVDQRRLDARDCADLSAAPATYCMNGCATAGCTRPLEKTMPPIDAPGKALIDGRSAFTDALRLALSQAARERARELCFVDADFEAWPLEDPAVLNALAAWARLPKRRLLVIACRFDDVPRRFPLHRVAPRLGACSHHFQPVAGRHRRVAVRAAGRRRRPGASAGRGDWRGWAVSIAAATPMAEAD